MLINPAMWTESLYTNFVGSKAVYYLERSLIKQLHGVVTCKFAERQLLKQAPIQVSHHQHEQSVQFALHSWKLVSNIGK